MNIIWTAHALHTYDSIIQYLLANWTDIEAQKFIDSVYELEEQLKMFPNSFPVSSKKQYLRKAVLDRHNSLVYQTDGNDVVFLAFLSNQQMHEY